MRKALRTIWNILQVFIIIYVILVTSLLFFENKYGFSQFGDYVIHNVNKLDTKNISGIKDGDLLIIKNKNKLKVGDTAYYYAVYNDKYVIASDKVVRVRKDVDKYLYTLNENSPIIISDSRVIGNKINTYPFIGKILGVFESRIGFIFFVLLPIMVVFVYQLYQFLLMLKYEKIVEMAETESAYVDDEIL